MTARNEKDEDDVDASARESLRSRVGWMPLLLSVAGLAIIAMIAYSVNAGPAGGSMPTDLSISNQMSNILEVNPLMTLGTPAPAFTLIDDDGAKESLSSLSGKSVVLTFGDDKCTDLCTLLAEDVLAADKDLGSNQGNVQFVSVNANPFYPSVTATRAWTRTHGLARIANWHFLTATPSVLMAMAKKYGVEVDLHAKTRTIDHGAEMFFISPGGDEEQIGDFGTESANTAEFAHATAQLATELLPAGDRRHVGGPTSSTAVSTAPAVGRIAPPIELPSLGTRVPITTTAYRGKYLAINFWSPTCSICAHELPAMQQASTALGSSAVIIGVDVSDPGGAGVAFAAKCGADYPMVSDASGVVAAQYEVPGLPYTVILDPTGRLVIRHPGDMTTEQVEYVLNTLTAESPGGN